MKNVSIPVCSNLLDETHQAYEGTAGVHTQRIIDVVIAGNPIERRTA